MRAAGLEIRAEANPSAIQPAGRPALPATRWARVATAVLALVLLAISPHPSLWSGPGYGRDTKDALDVNGVADERRYYFPSTGLFNGLPWGAQPGDPLGVAGLAARRDHVPLLPEGAIGITGYLAGPDTHILDLHALADPLLARLPCVRQNPEYEEFRRSNHLPPENPGWRPGHFRRNVPKGYYRTLIQGRNRIEDPAIARLWDRLRLITRGPLWSGARLAAVVRANLGSLGRPANHSRPDFVPIDFDEILSAAPDAPEILFRRAQASLKRHDFTNVEEDVTRAAALNPRYAPALAQIAEAARKRGEREHAAELLRLAHADDPGEIRYAHDLGALYMELEKYEDAVKVFRDAVALAPKEAELYNNLGVALGLTGRTDEARQALQEAIRIRPEQADGYDNLAQVERNAGRNDRACELYQAALRLDPPAEMLVNAAESFAEAGRLDDAQRALQEALRKEPGNAEALCALGSLLEKRGDRARAAQYYSRAAATGSKSAREAMERLAGPAAGQGGRGR